MTAGLVLLGFTAVYREGFEVVLFLQDLRLKYGAATVLEGVGIGLAFTAAVGVLTFVAHHRLPYKRMLVLTGAMIGFVLVVMVGESAQELQLAGWIPATQLGFTLPGWLGTWLAIFPTVETLAAQFLAAAAVIGSYLVAEHVRVRRPAKHGLAAGQRPELPPERSRSSRYEGSARWAALVVGRSRQPAKQLDQRGELVLVEALAEQPLRRGDVAGRALLQLRDPRLGELRVGDPRVLVT